MRDGTAEKVSRDQISGANADREIFIFPVQLTASRIGNLTRLILTLAICGDRTYIYKLVHNIFKYFSFNFVEFRLRFSLVSPFLGVFVVVCFLSATNPAVVTI